MFRRICLVSAALILAAALYVALGGVDEQDAGRGVTWWCNWMKPPPICDQLPFEV
jgi:hypothetical protein